MRCIKVAEIPSVDVSASLDTDCWWRFPYSKLAGSWWSCQSSGDWLLGSHIKSAEHQAVVQAQSWTCLLHCST